MTGYLLLEGGAEFGGQMSEPDRRAMALAGGGDAPISIIPTAAAPDNNYRRAGNNGVNWFQSLGATNVAWLPLIDKASANDASIVTPSRIPALSICSAASPAISEKRSKRARAFQPCSKPTTRVR
jgi:cyanophycinase